MNAAEYAMSWLGVNEKLKTHRPIIDLYNQIKPLPAGVKMTYTSPWCMAFASVCINQSIDKISFPFECSCNRCVKKLQDYDLWVEDDKYLPHTNDLVFYHWGHTDNSDCKHVPNHVGIVIGTWNGTIYCIEGNYSDSVKLREIPTDWKKIRGFAKVSHFYETGNDITYAANLLLEEKFGDEKNAAFLLARLGYRYEDVMAAANNLIEDYNVGTKSVNAVAMECIRGEWGNNPDRKRKLTEAGYDYNAVRQIINAYYQRKEK